MWDPLPKSNISSRTWLQSRAGDKNTGVVRPQAQLSHVPADGPVGSVGACFAQLCGAVCVPGSAVHGTQKEVAKETNSQATTDRQPGQLRGLGRPGAGARDVP